MIAAAAASTVESASGVGLDDATIAQALLVEAGWTLSGSFDVGPSSPVSVVTGEPVAEFGNTIVDVSLQTFDLGGRVLDPTAFTTPNLGHVDELEAGDPAWFAGQPGVQLVSVTTQLPPDRVDAVIAEIAIGYVDPSREVLDSSAFGPGDPLLGLNTNLSIAGVAGTTMVGHAIVSGGAWTQTANPLPVWTAYSPDGFHVALPLPLTATDIQVTLSETRDGTPDGLVSIVARPTPGSVVIVLDPAVDDSRLANFDARFVSPEDWIPPGRTTSDDVMPTDGDVDPPDDDPADDATAEATREATSATGDATSDGGSDAEGDGDAGDDPLSQPADATVGADPAAGDGGGVEDASTPEAEPVTERPTVTAAEDASGRSGWWWLIGLAPLAAIAAWLVRWWRGLRAVRSTGPDEARGATSAPSATDTGTWEQMHGRAPALRAGGGEMILGEWERTGLGAVAVDDRYLAPTNALTHLALAHPVAPYDDERDPPIDGWSGLIVDRQTKELVVGAEAEAAAERLGIRADGEVRGPVDSPETTVTPIDIWDGEEVVES